MNNTPVARNWVHTADCISETVAPMVPKMVNLTSPININNKKLFRQFQSENMYSKVVSYTKDLAL